VVGLVKIVGVGTAMAEAGRDLASCEFLGAEVEFVAVGAAAVVPGV